MKFIITSFAVIGALFCSSTIVAIEELPTAAAKGHIAAYLDKYAKDHLIPCFVSGYQVFTTDKNGTEVKSEERWLHSNGGWADIENQVKCTDNTMLRVASVSKAIGSGLVASLVDTGKLHWDDEVHKYLPDTVFPQKTWNGEKVSITLRELITHLSGLRHSTDHDLLHDWGLNLHNSTQLVAMFAKDPLLAKPGTKYIYSNSGWNLIGAIVEAVEKRSYHLVLNDYMRKTLGMKRAQSDSRLDLIPNRGVQYQVKADSQGVYHTQHAPITDQLRPFPHWPCGGVISTADDLITYGTQMLRSYRAWPNHFLKQQTVQSMWNYRPPISEGHGGLTINGVRYAGEDHRYVLGWDRVQLPVEPKDAALSHLEIVYHIGGTGGVNSILAIFPEQNMVFSAIANRGGAGDLTSLAAQVYHMVKTGK